MTEPSHVTLLFNSMETIGKGLRYLSLSAQDPRAINQQIQSYDCTGKKAAVPFAPKLEELKLAWID